MKLIAKELHVSEWTIRTLVHEDIWYKSYGLKRGQFLSAKTQENSLIHAKQLHHKVKPLIKMACFGSFLRTSLTKAKSLTWNITDCYLLIFMMSSRQRREEEYFFLYNQLPIFGSYKNLNHSSANFLVLYAIKYGSI